MPACRGGDGLSNTGAEPVCRVRDVAQALRSRARTSRPRTHLRRAATGRIGRVCSGYVLRRPGYGRLADYRVDARASAPAETSGTTALDDEQASRATQPSLAQIAQSDTLSAGDRSAGGRRMR